MTYAIKTGTGDQGHDIYFNQVKGSVDVIDFVSETPLTVDTLEEAETMLTSSKILSAMFEDVNPDECDFEIVEL